ncbi:MAG TPA: zinc ribbon domain-containing protein [Burkholderiaceae bacterium]|nr:zinc ribbon domain-containing protein [Burkholderiaceae bacterium]
MPIYAYRCASCGHAKDVLQKLSDPPLTVCPSCGAESFAKQVTAAGFQLKGSGWYATDFKGNGAKKPADGAAKTDAGKDDGAKTDTAKPDTAKSGDSAAPAKSGDAGSSPSTDSGGSQAPKAAGCGGGCACH